MLPIEYSGASHTKIAEVFHILILIPRDLVTFFLCLDLTGHHHAFRPSSEVGNPWIRLNL